MQMKFRVLFALGIVALGGHSAGAQYYPTRQIRIVVPFTPGGSNDVLGRIIAQKLTDAWGRPVIVENRTGAAGSIGAEMVAKAAPDGYTLLVAANNILAINPSMKEGTPFDPVKDFTPISLIGAVPILLAINPSLSVNSVPELISYAKAKPGELTFGSSGPGSPQHLAAELFMSLAGVQMQHVPYRGTAPALTDLMSGQINLTFGAVNSMIPFVKDGKLKALGVTTRERLSYLPDVPSIGETLPNYDTDIWIAFMAPAKTPKDIVTKLQGEIHKIFADPVVREQLALQGIEPRTSTAEELTTLISDDLARWKTIIARNGLNQ
jgi:tripartite-type tricarboxylate transporter receptor subunit TctC